MSDHCPHCDASLIGEPIAPEHLEHKADCDEQKARNLERFGWVDRCHCRPYGDATHFRREMGHEIQGVYDGTLFWSCPDCGLAWSRWTDGGRLTDAAADYVARYNAAATDGAA